MIVNQKKSNKTKQNHHLPIMILSFSTKTCGCILSLMQTFIYICQFTDFKKASNASSYNSALKRTRPASS
jgi:hypothetical protein